jgi:Transcriptional activator TraM
MTTNNADSIDVDDLIAKVAKQYNVLLSKDDPILVTVILNDLILKKSLELVYEQSATLKNDLNEIFLSHKNENINLIKMIINESKTATTESINKAASIFKTEVQNQVNIINLKNEQYQHEITSSKRIALFSAAIALAAMLTTIVILFL